MCGFGLTEGKTMINGQNTTKKINGGVAFVLAFAIFNFVGIICSLIVSAVGLEKSTLYYVISGLVSSVSFLIVILYFSYANRVNPLRISNVNKCSWIYFLLAIIIAIGMFFGFGFA